MNTLSRCPRNRQQANRTIGRRHRLSDRWRSSAAVGDAYDNALAEAINGLYKTELVHRQGPWRNMQDLEMATLGWVDWFNNGRLLGPIGNIPPAEAEDIFYAQRDVLDMVA